MRIGLLPLVGLGAALVLGCSGKSGMSLSTEDPPPQPVIEAPPSCTPTAPGESPFNHLTRAQYDNTVRDLFGDDSAPSKVQAFPPDDKVSGFDRGVNTSALLTERQLYAAESVSGTAAKKIDTLFPCDWANAADDCAQQFIVKFGPRVYRRPLTGDDVTQLSGIWTAGKPDGTEAGVALVIEAMLMSPDFLYHLELDTSRPSGDGLYALSDHELANRLSYYLWNAPPDETLRAAADQGQLETPEQVRAQAQRMLADPKTLEGVLTYYRQWLGLARLDGLKRDATLYPDFTEAHATDLQKSLELQIADWYGSGTGTFASLLSSDELFVNDRLAAYYALPFPGSGENFVKVKVPAANAAGLLGHPGLVTLFSKPEKSDPIHRGLFVRTQLLCDELAPPPANAVTTIANAGPDATTRERFAAHTSNPTCAACHRKIDPIGFGFESLDATGRVRTTEFGRPIDDSGELIATKDVDGPFHGPAELAHKLSGSHQVRACLVGKMLAYSVQQPISTESCAVDRISWDVEKNGDLLRAAPLSIVTDDTFRMRSAYRSSP